METTVHGNMNARKWWGQPLPAHLSADFLPQYSTKKRTALGTRGPKEKTPKPADKETGMWQAGVYQKTETACLGPLWGHHRAETARDP